jgi:hypothetical protein
VVTILKAEGSRTKKDNPQIELEVGNESGTLRDWLVYAEENGVRKVATLFRIAGIPLRNTDQDDSGELKDEVIEKLLAKKVGIVVVQEESYSKPGTMFTGIKGYVPPEAIVKGEAVPATAGVADDDLPF